MSGNVPPLAIFVVRLIEWADDITENLERALGRAPESLGLLAHRNDLHLRLAALGDSDRLAAFGDLVDQGETPRLEGRGVDLPFHGADAPMWPYTMVTSLRRSTRS